MHKFDITFFGTSGSSATSSQKRKKYGSNTSCVLVEAGEKNIILDMGSGLVQLSILADQYNLKAADILLSHFHYDHIEGVPFFNPFYGDGNFTIYAESNCEKTIKEIFSDYMKKPFFPVTPKAFSKGLSYHQIKEGECFNLSDDIYVETTHTNHPGVSTAYKIHFDGRKLVYLLDHEHNEKYDEKMIEFCKNADVVIYDATFTEEEYLQSYYGWGHSTPDAGINLAKKAEIKTLVLSHHSISRTDEKIDEIGDYAKKLFLNTVMATEGVKIKI